MTAMLGPRIGLGTSTDSHVDHGLTPHQVDGAYLDERGLYPKKLFLTSDYGFDAATVDAAMAQGLNDLPAQQLHTATTSAQAGSAQPNG